MLPNATINIFNTMLSINSDITINAKINLHGLMRTPDTHERNRIT